MRILPPWLKVLYPFETKAFRVGDLVLNTVDEGSGPAVVMLHGNPTWSFFYRDLIQALQQDFRCLALDHLGCGLSDKPQVADYTLAGHIERACLWIESLNLEAFHLVVHDWGGAIGFGVADRMRERISGITILNTAAFPFPSIPLRISVCRIPGAGRVLVRGANAFVRGAARMTTVQPLSEAEKEGYGYPYRSWEDRVAIHAFVKDIPMRSSHPSWKTLAAIEESLDTWRNKRVQILWGMRDWCFHEGILAAWRERLPGASVHRFENAGHYLLEDAGEAVYPLVAGFARAGGDWRP